MLWQNLDLDFFTPSSLSLRTAVQADTVCRRPCPAGATIFLLAQQTQAPPSLVEMATGSYANSQCISDLTAQCITINYVQFIILFYKFG